MIRLVSESPSQTQAIGVALGELLRRGDLLRLHGELGSGKTTLSGGIGRGLKAEQPLSSPSYLLCKEYVTEQGPLLHLDAYFEHRLQSLLGEGLVERLDDQHIVLVEWASNVQDWLPAEGLDVHMTAKAEHLREFQVCAVGPRALELLNQFSRSLLGIGISVEPDLT